MKLSGILLPLLLTLFVINDSIAQSPTISIQSTLKTIAGDAVADGNQSITFRLYATETGGTAVWTETATVEVTGGIYSHELGSVTALNQSNFGSQLYLGVTVGGGQELSPRTKLGYAPYAMAVNSISGGGQSASFNGSGAFNVSGAQTVGQRLTVNDDIICNDFLLLDKHASIGFDWGSMSGAPAYDLTIGDANTGIDVPVNDELRIWAGGSIVPQVPAGVFKRSSGNLYSIFPGRSTFGTNQDADTSVTIAIGDANTGLAGTSDILEFITGGSERMRINANGRVGINTTDPGCLLHVAASPSNWTTTNPTTYSYIANQNSGVVVQNNVAVPSVVAFFGGSIVAAQRIAAAATPTFSDQRIKINFKKSNTKTDLNLLNKIEITEYDHIDTKSQDNRTQKKVIAQQVQSVYPNAVSAMRKVIPNVYALADKVQFDNGKMTIVTPKAHGFIAGDKIDLKTDKKDLDEVEVLSVIDEHTFTVKGDVDTENVFVYGKYVDDFLTVDYDAISMLNVSATQELYNRLVALEEENQSLRAENSQIKQSHDALDGRLAKLEKLLSADNTNGLTQANEE